MHELAAGQNEGQSDLGLFRLKVWYARQPAYTPGHARHHMKGELATVVGC